MVQKWLWKACRLIHGGREAEFPLREGKEEGGTRRRTASPGYDEGPTGHGIRRGAGENTGRRLCAGHIQDPGETQTGKSRSELIVGRR